MSVNDPRLQLNMNVIANDVEELDPERVYRLRQDVDDERRWQRILTQGAAGAAGAAPPVPVPKVEATPEAAIAQLQQTATGNQQV